MQPLTLKRYLRLHVISSPLIYNPTQAKLEDLENAIRICSTTRDEPIHELNLKKYSWFQRLQGNWWVYKNRQRKDIPEQVKLFAEYLNDYCSGPKVFDVKSQLTPEEKMKMELGEVEKSGPVGSLPWSLSRMGYLMFEGGMAKDEVENLTIGEMLWLSETLAYVKTGKCNVVSSADERVLAEIQMELDLTV